MLSVCAALILAVPGYGQTAPVPGPAAPNAPDPASIGQAPRWQNRGRWNFGLQVGYGVENAIPRNLSHVNMLIVQPQVGLIVRDFAHGPLRRFEVVNEAVIGNAVHPGGHMWGNTLLFRFDGKPYRHVIPFLDIGASAMHTTLATRAPEVSGYAQFMPQAGLGIQYFFSPQRAFVVEYRYFHMSNAGLEQPNEGFNGSMLTIGFRWLRRPGGAGKGASRLNLFRYILPGL
jgi:opacity protein-like surface antigen